MGLGFLDGAVARMSQTTIAQPKPRSGCLWAFLVLVMFMVGSGVLIGGGVYWAFNGLAKSEAATQALRRASETPAVIDKLGAPLVRGTFATGDYSVNSNGTGRASLNLPISGPKGSGTLVIVGTRADQQWTFSRLVVVPADESGEILVK